MTAEEERLARAQANDADWEARQNQEFDPARSEQAKLDALSLIQDFPVPFGLMRACHREVSHSGNKEIAQRWAEIWLQATDFLIADAEKTKAKVEARNADLPAPESA